MGKTLQAKLAALPLARQAKIAARTAALITEKASLGELRRARSLTQKMPRQRARHRAAEHFKARKSHRYDALGAEALCRSDGTTLAPRCQISGMPTDLFGGVQCRHHLGAAPSRSRQKRMSFRVALSTAANTCPVQSVTCAMTGCWRWRERATHQLGPEISNLLRP